MWQHTCTNVYHRCVTKSNRSSRNTRRLRLLNIACKTQTSKLSLVSSYNMYVRDSSRLSLTLGGAFNIHVSVCVDSSLTLLEQHRSFSYYSGVQHWICDFFFFFTKSGLRIYNVHVYMFMYMYILFLSNLHTERLQLIDTTLLKCYIKVTKNN